MLESSEENVQIEAVAALANLAVNDENEVSIGEKGALPFIVDCMRSHNVELLAQASRALRNLSVDVSTFFFFFLQFFLNRHFVVIFNFLFSCSLVAHVHAISL